MKLAIKNRNCPVAATPGVAPIAACVLCLLFFSSCFLLSQNLKLGSSYVEDLGEGVKLEMIWIPPGEFIMGSDKYSTPGEKPSHRVRITKGFWVGKYEVTQEQWETVMGNFPSHFKRYDNPVESVSWEECQEFVRKLSARTRKKYRLPTEAEWEYAYRAGTNTDYPFGNDASQIKKYAWIVLNSGNVDLPMDTRWDYRKIYTEWQCKPHPVGKKLPNAWGLYDMHGNVAEWVQDFYDKDYYQVSPVDDPQGPSSSSKKARVARGGNWWLSYKNCSSSIRPSALQTQKMNFIGFRVAAESSTPRRPQYKGKKVNEAPKPTRRKTPEVSPGSHDSHSRRTSPKRKAPDVSSSSHDSHSRRTSSKTSIETHAITRKIDKNASHIKLNIHVAFQGAGNEGTKRFGNFGKTYIVYIDGKEKARLHDLPAQQEVRHNSKEIDVNPGNHAVVVRLYWVFPLGGLAGSKNCRLDYTFENTMYGAGEVKTLVINDEISFDEISHLMQIYDINRASFEW